PPPVIYTLSLHDALPISDGVPFTAMTGQHLLSPADHPGQRVGREPEDDRERRAHRTSLDVALPRQCIGNETIRRVRHTPVLGRERTTGAPPDSKERGGQGHYGPGGHATGLRSTRRATPRTEPVVETTRATGRGEPVPAQQDGQRSTSRPGRLRRARAMAGRAGRGVHGVARRTTTRRATLTGKPAGPVAARPRRPRRGGQGIPAGHRARHDAPDQGGQTGGLTWRCGEVSRRPPDDSQRTCVTNWASPPSNHSTP